MIFIPRSGMTIFCLAGRQAKGELKVNVTTFNFVCVRLCGSVAK
jgi:hypothetical protein